MGGKRLVVIGGTAAGLSAASKAKRLDGSFEVTVFERGGYVSYGSCGLPYFVGGMIREADDLVSLTAEELRSKRGFRVHTHTEVVRIDRARKLVEAKDLENGGTFDAPYDALVIATGSRPIIPPIVGMESRGVFTVRSVEDGIAIRDRAGKARAACVIGGGVIGLEMAEQLALRGLKVTIFEALDRLLPAFPEEHSRLVADHLALKGVDLHLSRSVAAIRSEGGEVVGVTADDGSTVSCDMVIVAVGVRPESGLAEAAGLELGLRSAIVVDERQRTSDPHIWACGDCAQMRHLITGKPVYLPLGTTANKTGRVAGGVIGGEDDRFEGVLGSMVTKVFDLYIASTGLSLQQALAEGYAAEQQTVIKGDRASYYPGSRDAHVNLVVDTADGRLLGAQGIGGETIAGRINVLVAAVTMGMTVSRLGELDLLYTPSVAPVYDPLLIAASQAMKLVRRRHGRAS